jgi:hypothetical protein
VFPLVNLAPNIQLVLTRWAYGGAYAYCISLVLPVLLVAPRALGRHRGRLQGVLAVLTISLLGRLAKPDQRLDDITPGLVAYLFTLVFLVPELSAPRSAMFPRATGPTSTT